MMGREQRWEEVRDDTTLHGLGDQKVKSSRLKVHGGYLYRTIVWAAHSNGVGASVSQTFVADPPA